MSITAVGLSSLAGAAPTIAPSPPDATVTPTQPPSDPFAILLAAANAPQPAAGASANQLTGAFPGVNSPTTSQLASLVSTPGTNASTPGSAIVSQAAQYIGVPYVWGGTSPSGFDCSGLVQYVFGQLGVTLPRTAAAQEQIGTPVPSLADAQPGDLLFFEPGQNGAPPGQAGHVGIYVGNGEMIDAPQTGETVQVQPVTDTPIAIQRVAVPAVAGEGSGPAAQLANVSVPSAYEGTVTEASAATGTPAPLLAAVLDHESGFNPSAVSSAGAEGIAQIMPGTAASNGINAFDPSSAISGAAGLLSQYHAAFGSWSDALAAYAAGPSAVETAGGVPNDGSTPNYVAETLSLAGMEPGS